MMLHNFREMEDFVLCQSKTKKLAVACAQDTLALDAVAAAVDKKIVTAVLIGKVDEICRILTDMGRRPSDFEMIQEDDDRKAVDLAVKMVREGAADIPMKGLMHTSTFMKGILDKETGLLPQGALLSQASVFEIPEKNRFLILTDCAVNIKPDVEQKVKIVENAVRLAAALGVERPKIAMISALEVVNPNIENTVEADEVVRRLGSKYCIHGPFALDNAIDEEAAKHKGIQNETAGKADILVMPDMWSGNMLTKGMVFFAHMRGAGTLNGMSHPVVMTSRTDTAENKYMSILAAVLQSIR